MVCITGGRGLEWNGAPGSEAKPCGLESSPKGALHVRPASLAPVGRTSMPSIRLRHALGYETLGSDLSEAMLARARQNLANRNVEIPLLQADYRRLPWHCRGPFDAVVCLGSIGYMPDEAGFLQAVRSMRAVLRDGGMLVLTATVTDKQWAQRPRFILAANTRDFSRLYVIDYLERRARYNVLDVFHGEQRQGFEVWNAELTVFLREGQQRLLERAGFRSVEFYGAFDFAPYDEATSDRLIAVACR
jgi:SAM-dependent methyltransferase